MNDDLVHNMQLIRRPLESSRSAMFVELGIVLFFMHIQDASANQRIKKPSQYSSHLNPDYNERRKNPLKNIPAIQAIGRFSERRKQKKADGIYHKISTSKGLEKAEWAEKQSNNVLKDRQFKSLKLEKTHGGKALRLKGFADKSLTKKYNDVFKKYERFGFEILFNPITAKNRLTSNASEFTINLGYEAMRALANGTTQNLDHELFHVSINYRNKMSDSDREANMLATHVIADYNMDLGRASKNYGRFYRVDEVPAIFAMAKSSHRRANNFIEHNDRLLNTMTDRFNQLDVEPVITHEQRSNTSFEYKTKSGEALFDIETYDNRISVSFIPRKDELPGAPGNKAIRLVMLVSKAQSKAFTAGKLDPLNHALETLGELSDYSHNLGELNGHSHQSTFDELVKELKFRY